MRRFAFLLAVCGFLCLPAGAAEISPPAADHTKIVGPETAAPGTMVQLEINSDLPFGAWAAYPVTENFRIDTGGDLAYWATPCSQAEQYFLLVTSEQRVTLQIVEIAGAPVIIVTSTAPVEVDVHQVSVGTGPGPNPDPDPDPDPNPAPYSELWCYIVYERELAYKYDRGQVNVIASPALRAMLGKTDKGTPRFNPIDPDMQGVDEKLVPIFEKAVKKAEGKELPWMILCSETGAVLWEGVVPKGTTALTETKALLEKYLPETGTEPKAAGKPKFRIEYRCGPTGCQTVKVPTK